MEDHQDTVTIDTEPEEEKRVPVSEAIRYRKRAQTAEQQLGDVQERLQTLQQQLDASRGTITALERRQKIDAQLTDADAIDLEAARLLTELAVQQMDEPDVELAIEDLRRHKPYLFRHRALAAAATMPARVPAEADQAEHAAERAAQTGDRRDLLRYLRLRRNA